MVRLHSLGGFQFPSLIADTTEELVGFAQPRLEFPGHLGGGHPVADSDIKPQFDFPLELVRVPPYPVGEVQSGLLSGEECLASLVVRAEILPVLRLRQLPDPVPEDRPREFAVLVIGERPLRVHAVDYDGGHPRAHLLEEPLRALAQGGIVLESEQAVSLERVHGSPQPGGLLYESPERVTKAEAMIARRV